jgi:hypothetical protein
MSSKDQLNDMLRQWAHNQEPSDECFTQLQKRITAGAVEWRYAERKTEQRRFLPMPVFSRLSYAVLGAVLAAVIAGYLSARFGGSNGSELKTAAGLAVISPQRIVTAQSLYNETSQLFDANVRWVVDSGQDMDIQIDAVPAGAAQKHSPVLMRMTVVSRKKGEKTWKSVWNSDVMIRGEDQVNVAPDRQAGNLLTAWVYPLEDGKVMVNSSLKLDVPVRIGSSINNIVEQNVPTQVALLKTEDSEYRVFQTVKVLNAG